MTMKKTILTILVALLVAVPVSAQTILNNTTLAAAVDGSSQTVRLTSASNVSVGDLIVIPGIPPEAMMINALSGTTATVTRGYRGFARPHSSAVVVYTGPGSRFQSNPPDTGASCTRSQIQFLPWIDINSGIAWTCVGSSSSWRGAVLTVINYASSSLPLAHLNLEPEPSLRARLSEWLGW